MKLVWQEVDPVPGAKRTWVLCYENGTPVQKTLPDYTEISDDDDSGRYNARNISTTDDFHQLGI
jgi:hypothetical protein